MSLCEQQLNHIIGTRYIWGGQISLGGQEKHKPELLQNVSFAMLLLYTSQLYDPLWSKCECLQPRDSSHGSMITC